MKDYLEQEKLLPEDQKRCRWGRPGTKDQLLIDKSMLNHCKKRHINLSMAWIDYKQAYDFVPHSWINECMDLLGIADNVRKILEKRIKQWKLLLTSNREDLGDPHYASLVLKIYFLTFDVFSWRCPRCSSETVPLIFGKVSSSVWMNSEPIICAPLHEKMYLRPNCCLVSKVGL